MNCEVSDVSAIRRSEYHRSGPSIRHWIQVPTTLSPDIDKPKVVQICYLTSIQIKLLLLQSINPILRSIYPMSWQGANTLHRGEQRNRNDSNGNKSIHSETVEAVLNRLMKAYSTSMECVGAFHRSDAAICKSSTIDAEMNSTASIGSAAAAMYRVGRAARHTFEISILTDPLVSVHTPSCTRRILTGKNLRTAWTHENQRTRSTVQLTSATHKSTVQQLAYLSLVNYADLLLMGLRPNTTTNTTVLDRGVIKCLQSFHTAKKETISSCWIMNDIQNNNSETEDNSEIESEQDTVRLALIAYIDATAIDGSDPTVWLKLACAARRLGRLLNNETSTIPVTFLKHRRLERYALERSVSALPSHDPPNRTAVQALREWHNEQEQSVDQNFPDVMILPKPVQLEMLLELPRYSWSTLGRLLLRACKEGSLYTASTQLALSSCDDRPMKSIFLSPKVSIHVCPLLVIPSTILARIVSYLKPSQLWCLEATCRALSASIVAARVILDTSSDTAVLHRPLIPLTDGSVPGQLLQQLENETIVESSPRATLQHSSADEVAENDVVAETSKRISKRVRSQIITSGKRAERSARRYSTEFCLLATILGCTADDPAYERLLHTYKFGKSDSNDSETSLSVAPVKKQLLSEGHVSDKDDTIDQLNESSLCNFIKDCSSMTALSPLACIFRFVARVSIHASQVFTNDPAGAMGMCSNLMDCKLRV
jgi:hypothetical protein